MIRGHNYGEKPLLRCCDCRRGVAGLYTALSLPEDQKILMLSKEGIENCDSMLAQGGICVMRDEEGL